MLRTVIERLLANDREWFNRFNIHISPKQNHWMLNYAPGPRNDYNKLVRGMVVRRPAWGFKGDPLSLIVSYPFTRFFNQGEKEADEIVLHRCDLLEKLDGTMVGVFFEEGPVFHTRKMLSCDPKDYALQITTFHGKKYVFLPTIDEYVKKLKFAPEDKDYTYVFEFVHEVSHVVTKYPPERYGLYLIGARHMPTHQELSEDNLDDLSIRLDARRPARFPAVQHKEYMLLMKHDAQDFEGFVFRDRLTGNRVKLKDADYLRKHHLLDETSYKNLLPLVLLGEEEEILAYFPHLQPRVDEIKVAYEKFLSRATEVALRWRGQDRKAVAMALFHRHEEENATIRNLVMRFLDEPDPDVMRPSIDTELRKIVFGQPGQNAGSPKRLLEIIGLQEDTSQLEDL